MLYWLSEPVELGLEPYLREGVKPDSALDVVILLLLYIKPRKPSFEKKVAFL